MVDKVTLTVPVAKVLAAMLTEPTADRYGLDLMKATGLASGTLYPVLVRLRAAGWVEAHWEEVDPAAAGRPARRYYRLSADGAARAAVELAALRAQTSLPARTSPTGGVQPTGRALPRQRPAW